MGQFARYGLRVVEDIWNGLVGGVCAIDRETRRNPALILAVAALALVAYWTVTSP
jgi:hypothetical protein